MSALERLWGPDWQGDITDADRERANSPVRYA